jgi:uncharacterized OB-fold protein
MGPNRILPLVTDANRHFWTCGPSGPLRILRCGNCGRYVHPPNPLCPRCLTFSLSAVAVSGRGSIWSLTTNRHTWIPGFDPPYAIAHIDLEEQPGLRVLSNIVGPGATDARIGDLVEVTFEMHGEIAVPLFRLTVGRTD